MDYDNYKYLYPPRPENKIPKGLLAFYEKRGYLAQVKKNGTCTVVFAKKDRVIFKTRHADDHKMWAPNTHHVEFFQGNNDWCVFVAELLHSKTPHIKDQLYVFDMIVHDGIQLVGKTFVERQQLLQTFWTGIVDEDDQVRVGKYVSVAKTFSSNDRSFSKMLDTLKKEDEGLVLKAPNVPMQPCFREGNNTSWQVKARIAHKNYSF